jgi:hypothetical protein
MPDGNGGNFTTRTNGLDVYVSTYLAVAKELKRVVPSAAFGPSNMAGISGGANGGGTDATCASCIYLKEFADRVKAAGAPLDFIAASEYSKWDMLGTVHAFRQEFTLEDAFGSQECSQEGNMRVTFSIPLGVSTASHRFSYINCVATLKATRRWPPCRRHRATLRASQPVPDIQGPPSRCMSGDGLAGESGPRTSGRFSGQTVSSAALGVSARCSTSGKAGYSGCSTGVIKRIRR